VGFVDGEVIVRQVDAKRWELTEPVAYRGAREEFTVPAGFETDFASIPRLVVWLIPRYGLYTRSAILHDFLWRTHAVSRADADGLFRRSMRELGVSMPRRWMMWAAVRLASGMRGATAKEWLAFAVVAPLSLAFVAVPAVVVQAYLVLFWLVELAFWSAQRLAGKGKPPAPRLQVRTA
jgi:hypothetical protein